LGQFLDAVVDIVVLEIERDGAGRSRELEPFGNGIDGDHAVRPEQTSAANGELADRPAPPDRDRLAAFQVAEIGSRVAGGEMSDRKEKRAILASWASDASAIASCPSLRAPEGVKGVVSIDEIFDALYAPLMAVPTSAGRHAEAVAIRARALAA
jgi:hypothetical protein